MWALELEGGGDWEELISLKLQGSGGGNIWH